MLLVDEIITRMITAVGAKNQQDLIRRAELSPGIPSQWRSRGKVSTDAIVDICLRFGVNVQWLAEGKGPMQWGEIQSPVSEPQPDDCTLKAAYTQPVNAPPTDPLRVAVDAEIDKLTRPQLAEVLSQLIAKSS